MHLPQYLFPPYFSKTMRYFSNSLHGWYDVGHSRLRKKLLCSKALHKITNHNGSAQMHFSSSLAGHCLQYTVATLLIFMVIIPGNHTGVKFRIYHDHDSSFWDHGLYFICWCQTQEEVCCCNPSSTVIW